MNKAPRMYGGHAGSKLPPVSMSRTVAQTTQPSAENGAGENRAKFFTYFTKLGPTETLYNGDRQWASVILTLETAGPVAVGDSSSIVPVLSGKGQLLETDVPTTFTIAKGTRLYVAATGINRIKVEIAPYPWMEQIVGLITNLIAAVAGSRT